MQPRCVPSSERLQQFEFGEGWGHAATPGGKRRIVRPSAAAIWRKVG
ncbi:hypothetical protein I545_6523 [Mycobacterium kansasii 662]|uniref:Uncharacterized protein n=1 Tax=Mycobacterium kansasii 662 TaxID=1299326 RepID=X7YFY6_MYCKA|nr:hypothetical protein I545_6523 [Mycobacterium kansasii 662]